jgi:hypothetical protein
VSHGSISNIINKYKREHEQPPQSPINQQFIKSQSQETSPIIGTISKDTFGSPSFKNGDELATNFPGVSDEVDFSDNPYPISDEFLNDIYYSEEFDGESGERILGYVEPEQDVIDRVDISGIQYDVVTKTKKIKETPEEPHQPRSSRSDIENKSVGLFDWDSEENYKSRFIRRVLQDKKNFKIKKDTLELHWRRLKEERQIFENRRKEFEAAEADLARRITQVKDFIPIAAELAKTVGFDFNLANSWIT